jgi:MFS family permease
MSDVDSMNKARNFSHRAWVCALSTLLLNGSMGSLYAWSVFVSPLERELMVGRAGTSFVFSVAVVAFTGGVAVAPYFYRLMRGPLLLMTFSLCSVIGLFLASFISSLNPSSWWFLIVGYGVLFGFGAGGTYSVSLQLINIALEKKRGLANGLGIGSFAAGSVVFSLVFSWALTYITVQEIFLIFGFVLLGVGITVGSLVWMSGFELPKTSIDQKAMRQGTPTIFPLLWLGFCCGAFAGLMAIGHAANFIEAYGGTALMITLGVVSVSIGNAIGRLTAGILSDVWSPAYVAVLAHLISLAGFILLLMVPGPWAAVISLGMQGLAYGFIAGAYPSAIAIYIGVSSYGRYFGRLILAWGIAGLTAPWVTGWFFDHFGSYREALFTGTVFSLVGILIAFKLFYSIRASATEGSST